MNWVLVVVLAILALSAISGYCKGMLRIVYSLISWILVLAFVSWATPQMNLYLLENTEIYEKIESHCLKQLQDTASEEMQKQQEEMQAEAQEEWNDNETLAALGVNLPEEVLEGILDKASDTTGEFLEESGIYERFAQGMATFLLEGISFVVVLAVAWLLVHIISQVLGIVSKIPVIKGVNRLLGLFVGAIYGLLLVWLGFYVTALGSTAEAGQIIISYIYKNEFLTFLYENNLVLTFIMKFF